MASTCRKLASLAAAAVVAASSMAAANIVDAGTFTDVTVTASAYDMNTSPPSGCPGGCTPDKTRDGERQVTTSRWSCKPELSAENKCRLTFDLGEPIQLEYLNIALYKGNLRKRIVDVYINGGDLPFVSWDSSGYTTDFERVNVEAADVTQIELVGALEDYEWLSILEVQIMAEDGLVEPTASPTSVIPAPVFIEGAIVVTGDLWDTRTAANNGCDPNGCVPQNTRVDASSPNFRWSCKPSLGGPGAECSVNWDVGSVGLDYKLAQLGVEFYKGDERTRTVDLYVDGNYITRYTSTGFTTDMEFIDLTDEDGNGVNGEVITLVGVLEDEEWLSIVWVEPMIFYQGVFRAL